MVEEALGHGLVQRLYVSEQHQMEAQNRFGDVTTKVEVLSEKVFAEVSDTMTPQGVLATVKMPEYHLQDYLKKENISFLCLEDINDPGNLGTMMRTAEGAGMTGVIMSKGTVDIFNPKVVRSTMGSLFRVPFFYTEDFCEAMNCLQDANVTLYAAHLKGSTAYMQEKYEGNTGIMIGNEANGLSEAATSKADCLVRIPMDGQLESLNAAVSAAILMYEVRRNRRS